MGVLVAGVTKMDKQDVVAPQISFPDQPVKNVQPVAGVGLTFEQKNLVVNFAT